jgi:DNA (cytosine-5)-methyltransferase 1
VPPNNNRPQAISLFAGAGGMDLGFIQAGFKVAWANDFDKDCCETYRLNIGSHIVCEDIDKTNINHIPKADVIIGGPPCQGFSVAGKMDIHDPRNRLLYNFVEVVRVKRPKYFVLENVKALGTLAKWSLVRSTLLAAFQEIGYKVEYRVLNAADYGVPQLRERVFFIGTSIIEGLIGFPSPTHLNQWIPARNIFVGLPEPGEAGNEGKCMAKIRLTTRPVLRKSPYAGMLFNGQGRLIDLNKPAPTMHASMGGNKTPMIDLNQLNNPSKEPWINRYHKGILEGKPAGTCNPPDYLRRITMREAARLQTFPDDFKFCGKLSSQYRQVGNAVPPRLAYCIARGILDCLCNKNEPQLLQGDQTFQFQLFHASSR